MGSILKRKNEICTGFTRSFVIPFWRSPGGGQILSLLCNELLPDPKDARIAELEGHVKSLLDQVQYLTEKDSKHARECCTPRSRATSTARSHKQGGLRDCTTQTECISPAEPPASPCNVFSDSGLGVSRFESPGIPEDVTFALNEILSCLSPCTCGAERQVNSRHAESCFSVSKDLLKVSSTRVQNIQLCWNMAFLL